MFLIELISMYYEARMEHTIKQAVERITRVMARRMKHICCLAIQNTRSEFTACL